MIGNLLAFQFQGQKLKEALIKTGSLSEVDACASQLRSHAVKEKNVEKPVTKKMLAEVYHWDESFDCKLHVHECCKKNQELFL